MLSNALLSTTVAKTAEEASNDFLEMIKTILMGDINIGPLTLPMWSLLAIVVGIFIIGAIIVAALSKKRVSHSELNNADEIVKDVQIKYGMSKKQYKNPTPAYVENKEIPNPETAATPIEELAEQLFAVKEEAPVDNTTGVEVNETTIQENCEENEDSQQQNEEQPSDGTENNDATQPVEEKKPEEEIEVPVSDRYEKEVNFDDLEMDDILDEMFEEKAEEPAQEPVAEEKVEEPAQEPVVEEKAEEPAQEPVAEEKVEEPAQEPIAEEKAEEPAQEPIAEEKAEDPTQEPVVEEKTEEPVQEPIVEEKVEEPTQEPVVEEKAEELVQEPIAEEKAEEPAQEPVVEEKAEEPVQEPIVEEKVDEPTPTPIVEVAEPTQEPIVEEKTEENVVEKTEEVAAEQAATPSNRIQATLTSSAPVIKPSTTKKAPVAKKANLIKAPSSRPANAKTKKASQAKAISMQTKAAPANTISNFAPITMVNNDKAVTIIKLFGDKIDPKFGKFVVEQIPNELVKPFRFVIKDKQGVTVFVSEGYKIRPRARQIETLRKAVEQGSIIYGKDANGYFTYKLMTSDNKIFGSGMPNRSLEAAQKDGEFLKVASAKINYIEDPTA
ncbi:MAG: hypothetical protein SO434_07235 [Eubacteriales bacterium]|nr:hypothetical protein [Eubacteriales bacterium]